MAGKTARIHVPEPGNEAPAANEAEVPVSIRLAIPQELYAEYEQSAYKQGLTVTELIMHRLVRCKDHSGRRTLFFSDTQREQLERILQKRPIESADQALALLGANLVANVGQFPIQFTAPQIKRISMGGYGGLSAEERFAQIVLSAVAKSYGV